MTLLRTDILERKEEILQWIEEARPKCYICQQLHCRQATLNSYLEKMGIVYAGQQNKKGQHKGTNLYLSADHYFGTDKHITPHKLKEKILRDELKERKCEICGLSEWMEKPIPLELHHKDGDRYNNDFDNLQIICPNCHAQQPGNSGANIKKS